MKTLNTWNKFDFGLGINKTLLSGVFFLISQRTSSGTIQSFLNVLKWNVLALVLVAVLAISIAGISYLLSRNVWLTRTAFVLLIASIILLVSILFFNGMSLFGAQAMRIYLLSHA